MSAATPWERGRIDGRTGPPQLLFGQMREDWRIEAEVFPRGGRIFCIASAGCVALALAARGFRVTAVDVNPAQIEYVRARAAGAPMRAGVIDRRLALARRAFPWLGLRRRDLRRFLELADPGEQTAFWHRRLDTRRFRAFLQIGLSPAFLRLKVGRALIDSLPARFDLAVRRRLERTWASHPNRSNPFLWRLLLGCDPPLGAQDGEPAAAPLPADVARRALGSGAGSGPGSGAAPMSIELACADAVAYLDGGPAGRFDGFTLSNIVEAAPPPYQERLLAAVRRAAAPAAVLVVRSLLEQPAGQAADWSLRDRSPLWGAVAVSSVNGSAA